MEPTLSGQSALLVAVCGTENIQLPPRHRLGAELRCGSWRHQLVCTEAHQWPVLGVEVPVEHGRRNFTDEALSPGDVLQIIVTATNEDDFTPIPCPLYTLAVPLKHLGLCLDTPETHTVSGRSTASSYSSRKVAAAARQRLCSNVLLDWLALDGFRGYNATVPADGAEALRRALAFGANAEVPRMHLALQYVERSAPPAIAGSSLDEAARVPFARPEYAEARRAPMEPAPGAFAPAMQTPMPVGMGAGAPMPVPMGAPPAPPAPPSLVDGRHPFARTEHYASVPHDEIDAGVAWLLNERIPHVLGMHNIKRISKGRYEVSSRPVRIWLSESAVLTVQDGPLSQPLEFYLQDTDEGAEYHAADVVSEHSALARLPRHERLSFNDRGSVTRLEAMRLATHQANVREANAAAKLDLVSLREQVEAAIMR